MFDKLKFFYRTILHLAIGGGGTMDKVDCEKRIDTILKRYACKATYLRTTFTFDFQVIKKIDENNIEKHYVSSISSSYKSYIELDDYLGFNPINHADEISRMLFNESKLGSQGWDRLRRLIVSEY